MQHTTAPQLLVARVMAAGVVRLVSHEATRWVSWAAAGPGEAAGLVSHETAIARLGSSAEG